jgi:GTP-binding protein
MIDTATIVVKAGNGGNGSLSFRRAKFMPKGGPDGGDGGNGGSVYVVGDKDMNTLQLFMGKQKFEATPGGDGTDNKKHGANGQDLEIKITRLYCHHRKR